MRREYKDHSVGSGSNETSVLSVDIRQVMEYVNHNETRSAEFPLSNWIFSESRALFPQLYARFQVYAKTIVVYRTSITS